MKRVFLTDFNDPDVTAVVHWWEKAPTVGEEIVLTDHDHNLVEARVAEVITPPDRDKRKQGLVRCDVDYPTWLDGAHVISLALGYSVSWADDSDQRGPVAQRTEQRCPTPTVAGSIPARPTPKTEGD